MAKNSGVGDIESWNFVELNLPQEWKDHLGELCENFRIHIEGPAKNGKTEYVFQLCQVLCEHVGKVNFNSTEQYKTRGFQMAFRRNNMSRFKGKFTLADRSQSKFPAWFKKLQGVNIGKVIVLDSTNYMGLTFAQWCELNDRFPHKSIILISWKGNPLGKQLEFMMDAIIEVKDFEAKVVSRLGGGKSWPIWPERIAEIKKAKGGKAVPANQSKLF